MNTSDPSQVQCLLTESTCNQSGTGEVSPGHLGHNSNSGVRSLMTTTTTTTTSITTTATPVEVKTHQHKHNLKHRFEVMETLGKGTYGKVKKAMERTTQNTVAIKSIRKERITEDLDRVHIQREIEITASLRHPNIIRFFEVFESRDKIVIVMEYASRGELYDYVHEHRRLSEAQARDIFRQITSAVHYCHKNGVVHRDLKLENILLDQDLNVKLADFGLSNRYQKNSHLQTFCGSPLYASPEIVKGLPYLGPEVDCWALGVLLYALVYGSMPFDAASHAALTEQIAAGRYHKPNPPSDACALIDWLLAVRVEERATVEDVANHWWVNWGYDEALCDCPSPPHQDCPSPMLARYIDWKSRKENAVPRTPPGAACCVPGGGTAPAPAGTSSSAAERRKPKGILKAQRSLDSALLLPSGAPSRPGSNAGPRACGRGNAGQPAFRTPKKGILKNLCTRECGYVLPPERRANAAVRRRGGILKRNGKFSRSLDLPDEPRPSRSGPPVFPEVLQRLLREAGDTGRGRGSLSRPSSAVSEDSLFSSDSFDLLDLSVQSHRRIIFSGGARRILNFLSSQLYDHVCANGRSKGDSIKGYKQHSYLELRVWLTTIIGY
uniref:non-specific serine/threonine protein kinase n=1 Tax=Gadus morhua TaxID=8049 RepID=A0A8C4ZP10_GADMO